jgi:hypothetical protein
MAVISRSELIYKDYSWTSYGNDDPKVSGEPDSTLLNRKEGYEILYFINKLSEDWKFKNKSSTQKIERLVRENVPHNLHSQKEIKKWISENWDNY